MGGKLTHKKNEPQSSALRILGAAFFGFLLGSVIRTIVNYTVPAVLMRIKNIRMEDAQNIYHSSIFVNILLGAVIVFFTAAIAGFLAKRSGALVGLLTNIVPILFLFLAMIYTILLGANPLLVAASSACFQFALMVLASVSGGIFGQYFYKEERDLDLGNKRLTIFGICLWHYLWIVPLIFYPFISSIVVIIYAWIFTFSTSLFFVTHLNLWINVAWWFYFFINPFIIVLTGLLMVFSFSRFWKVMNCKQTFYTGWERIWQVLFYGMLAPVLARLSANFTIKATENMFQPIINDWKISVLYILFIPAVGLILYVTLWITSKIVSPNNHHNKHK